MLARQHRQTARLGRQLSGSELAALVLLQQRMLCLVLLPIQFVCISLFHRDSRVGSRQLSTKQNVRLGSVARVVSFSRAHRLLFVSLTTFPNDHP
eukprot:COSAG02_NODE_45592_length_355_cov_6.304688_1_plen_94_part_10